MTFNQIRNVTSPLLATFILLNGISLFGSFLPLRLESIGSSTWEIAIITTAFYAGITLGSFKNADLIIRVGHIRAFSAFAAIISVVVLIKGLVYSLLIWSILRCILGYCLAGLYVVLESWILKEGTPKTRGQMLALYMICLNGGTATGQLFLKAGPIDSTIPFMIVAILCCISILPLAIGKVGNPVIESPSALTIKELFALSQSGIISCFVSGALFSTGLAFLPLFINFKMGGINDTAMIMFIVMLGGMLMQYPIGKASDIIDRRIVLLILCAIISIISGYIYFISIENMIAFYIVMFIIGGLLFAVYPLSISLTCDVLKSEDIVSAVQGLVLVYGVGAAIGPMFATIFIEGLGSVLGLFIFYIVCCLSLGAYLTVRIFTVPAHTVEEYQEFVSVPNTTPVAAELDPRSED